MYSFRVECSIRCPRCERPVFLNGPVTALSCRSCRSSIEVPPDFWGGILKEAVSEMRTLDIGTGSNSTIFGAFSTSLSLARFDPYCDSCKTDFESPWELRPGDDYACRECGEVYQVCAPPDWMDDVGLSAVRMLVNADVGEEPAEETTASSEPVALSCPQCGGWLKVDGSDRLVECDYCSVQVYLPDDLWFRLHPVRRKRRWFVVCG